jgi:hypothetical protein
MSVLNRVPTTLLCHQHVNNSLLPGEDPKAVRTLWQWQICKIWGWVLVRNVSFIDKHSWIIWCERGCTSIAIITTQYSTTNYTGVTTQQMTRYTASTKNLLTAWFSKANCLCLSIIPIHQTFSKNGVGTPLPRPGPEAPVSSVCLNTNTYTTGA